jgi:signal transduction histidine kinase
MVMSASRRILFCADRRQRQFLATQRYLIAVEAVHNAVKHAQAQAIEIRIEVKNGLRLCVQDDGVGLGESGHTMRGMGLRIMRHRAAQIGATLRLESPPDGGTRVTCALWKTN